MTNAARVNKLLKILSIANFFAIPHLKYMPSPSPNNSGYNQSFVHIAGAVAKHTYYASCSLLTMLQQHDSCCHTYAILTSLGHE